MMKYSGKPFSSGMEYEFFLDNWCKKCTHFKLHNGLFPEYPEDGGCPVLDAMECARFDLELFPADDIIEERDDDGNVIYWHKCTKYEEKRDEKMTNYEALKMPGVLGEFIRCALSKGDGVNCDCCDMWKKCGVKREENRRGCDFDWRRYFKSHAEEYSIREMALRLSAIFYTICDYCPVGDHDEICGYGEGREGDCAKAFEEWLSEENWLIEPLLKTTPLGFYHEQ